MKKQYFNPPDRRKRKKITIKTVKAGIMSSVMAAVTAATTVAAPILSYAAGLTETDSSAQTQTITNDDGTQTILNTSEGNETADSTEVSSEDEAEETRFLFLKLKNTGGKIVIDKGEDEEHTVRLVKHKSEDGKTDEEKIDVYDKDDVLVSSEDAAKNNYTYAYEVKSDSVANVKAEADEGYVLKKYEVKAGDANKKADLNADDVSDSHEQAIFMDENKTVDVEFEKSSEDDAGVTDETTQTADEDVSDDCADDTTADNNTNEDADVNDDKEKDEDISVDDSVRKGADAETEDVESKADAAGMDDDLSVVGPEEDKAESEAETAVDENDTDDVTEAGDEELTTDAEAADDSETTDTGESADETVEEHFLEKADGVDELNADEFASARLIVMTDAESGIVDKEHLIGSYGNIYLLQYKDATQAMNAYMYYKENAEAVEPDAIVEAATENASENACDSIPSETESNAIAALNTAEDSVAAKSEDNVIALIDTGVSESENIVDRISLIDDDLTGKNSHGDTMVKNIVSQNNEAKILSIRALGDNGQGSISDVIAAMEYAIKQNVGIINLSISTRKDSINKILETEIDKAVGDGITVVGAAGNNGDDASGYMPASVDSAYIIGACNKEGVRLTTSNYGDTVDYNAVANSTSEAAAMFSGYASKCGIKNVKADKKDFFDASYRSDEVSQGDGLKVYYLFYDASKPDIDEHTKNIVTNIILKYPYEKMSDGSLHCLINPDASKYNYNLNGADGTSLAVDVDRGAHGGRQQPITDECTYDEQTGYIDIPAEYADKDVTVTVWQDTESAFYKNLMPDEIKPEEDQTGKVSVATFSSYFPNGTYPAYFIAKGCNMVYLKGDISKYTVGKSWQASATTHNVGNGGVSFNWVSGMDVYHNGFGAGQIFNIHGCSDSIFNNIGGKGADGLNWLFGGCVSDVSNNFDGDPVVTDFYIECIKNDSATARTFFFRAKCSGPSGQTAQTMVGFFCASITTPPPTTSKFSVYKCMSLYDQLAKNTSRVGEVVDTTFTIYTNKDCAASHIATMSNGKKAVIGKGGNVPLSYMTDSKTKKTVKSKAYATVVLKPGTYYVKETGRISGTIQNTNVYGPCKIAAGKSYKLRDFVKTADRSKKSMTSTGYVVNYPFRFKGAILTKKAGDTKKPLAGAIYKVQYSEQGGTNFKAKRTWYLKSDSNGQVKVDGSHLASGYKSSALFYVTNADNTKTYFLPVCSLKITEVKAPEGYQVVKTTKTISIVTKPKDSKLDTWVDYNAVTSEKYEQIDPHIDERWRLTVYAKKIDQNGNPLAGAVFGVYETKENAKKDMYRLKTLTTGSDGLTPDYTYPDLDQATEKTCTLYCKELKAPDGFALPANNEPLSLTFSLSDYKKLTKKEQDSTGERKPFGGKGVINTPEGWAYSFRIKKIDEKNKPLKGAEFSIYKNQDDAEAGENELDSYVTDEDGLTPLETMRLTNDVSEITLYCRETAVPDGYILNDEVFTLTWKKADYDKLSDTDKKNGKLQWFGSENGIVNEHESNPSGWNLRAQIKKVDDDNKPLADAVFGIYTNETCDEDSQVAELTSGEDGLTDEFTYEADAANDSITLYCKETDAPDGYDIDDKVYSQTWTHDEYKALSAEEQENGKLKMFGPVDGIVNHLSWRVRMNVKKINKKKEPLAGAQFEVYGDKNCSSSEFIGTLTTGQDGMSNTISFAVDSATTSITLWCKETKAPKGYLISKEIASLTFDKSEYKTLLAQGRTEGPLKTFAGEGFIDDEITPPTVKIQKKSTVSDEILELSGYSLKGAEFEITGNGFTGRLITAEDGTTEELSLPTTSGEYQVTEVKAPLGHTLDSRTQTIKINMPQDNGKKVALEFTDEPIFVSDGFQITKTDENKNPIKGVVFKVEFMDTDITKKTWYLVSDEKGLVKMDTSYTSKEAGYKSDGFYKHNNKVVIPIGGTLKITEVKAPAEYTIDSTPKYLTTGKDEKMKLDVINTSKPCKISIRKFDTDGKTPLKGVQFELKFLKSASVQSAPNRLLKVGESTKGETDANGNLVFDNLDRGQYQITETKTAEGHTLLKDPITVILPITMTKEEAIKNKADTSKATWDAYTNKWQFYDCTFEVTNSATFKMPMTGGTGNWKYGIIGFGTLAVLGTGLILMMNPRKQKRRRK